MSSPFVDSTKTAIPEEPKGFKGLSAAKGKNEREYALPVHNNTTSDVNLEPLTSEKPEFR